MTSESNAHAPAEPAPPSPRFILGIIGGFGLLAILVLAGSWPGYQISRHTKAAEAAEAGGDYAAAVEHLTYITNKYPTAFGRQRDLGNAYLELEKPREAIKAFELSLKGDPDQNLKAAMGRARFLLGDKAEAIKLLKAAIEADPNDAAANFYIALYYMGSDNPAKASFFFEAAGSDKRLREKSRPYLEEIKRRLLDVPPSANP